MRKYLLVFLVVPIICLAVSCAPTAADKATADTAAPAPPYNTVATIKDIMDSMVDPSADYIWESVGTEVSAKGVIEKAPKTDDEWKEERRRAILLVEAANLLVMPGRKVAQAGEKSENPGIELGPEEIMAIIDGNRATFHRLAHEFQQTAIEQLEAVNKKDLPALLKVGGDIDTRCENCHKTYWYPNDPAFKNDAKETEKDKAANQAAAGKK
jgi:hypothetical protein